MLILRESDSKCVFCLDGLPIVVMFDDEIVVELGSWEVQYGFCSDTNPYGTFCSTVSDMNALSRERKILYYTMIIKQKRVYIILSYSISGIKYLICDLSALSLLIENSKSKQRIKIYSCCVHCLSATVLSSSRSKFYFNYSNAKRSTSF